MAEEEKKEKKKKKKKKTKKVEDKRMSFFEHLEEMRWVLIKCIGSIVVFSIVSYLFSERLVNFLTAPYPYTLIALGPADVFMVRIKLSVTTGVVASLPVIIYQFWSFVAPGLLQKEKRFVPWIIFFTILCFLIGASFAYYMIIPLGLKFFAKFQTEKLVMSVSIDKYLSFVTRILIAFGATFELPIMSMFLAKIGLLTPDVMKRIRGYAIILIFVGASILTPPDVITQLFLAFPLLILYEVSIWLTKIFAKRAEEEWEEEEEELEEEGELEEEI